MAMSDATITAMIASDGRRDARLPGVAHEVRDMGASV